jgi:hypothetical protein
MKTKLVSILLISLVLASPALAQDTAAKAEKAANIQRLLKLVGAESMQNTMIDQIMGMLKPMFTANAPADEATLKMLNRLSDLMTEEFRKSNFSSIAPELYDKYFTNDEIKGMIAFYESPLGRKTIQVLPALTSESMSRGQKLGEQAGQRAFARLLDEYPELKKALQGQQQK